MSKEEKKKSSKLGYIYKLALPLYVLYVIVFELFADYNFSDLWSKLKKFMRKGKKELKRNSKFIKMKLRDSKTIQ